MARKPYPGDLTDEQWKVIEDLIPPGKPGGRPREVSMREIINAIMYVLRRSCAWRVVPHDFSKWNIVYHYVRRFRRDNIWRDIHDLLRDELRMKEGREVRPSAAIMDNRNVNTMDRQSVRNTETNGFAVTTRARRSRVASAI